MGTYVAERVERVCQGCGIKFRILACEVAAGKGKYCTFACYNKSRAGGWVNVICKKCGQRVTVRRAYVERGQYKFCSDPCRLNAKTTPKERKKTCKTCGAPFTCTSNHARRIHCSNYCRRRRVFLRCGYCRRWFGAPRDQAYLRTHCCMSCRLRATMSVPQRKALAALRELGVECTPERRILKYYVDIIVWDLNLVIEIDGEYWHSLDRQVAKDRVRDAAIEAEGLTVLHVAANHVMKDPIKAMKEVLDAAAPL